MPVLMAKLHRILSDMTTASLQSETSINAALQSFDSHGRLINLSALVRDHDIDIAEYQAIYFKRINEAVRTNLTAIPTRHGNAHAVRIVKTTQQLYLAEKHRDWAQDIDIPSMYIAALICTLASTHDWDIELGTLTPEAAESAQYAQWDAFRDFLDALKVPPQVAGTAAYISSFVSFAREMANPEAMETAMRDFPALKIVVDAQRLCEMGLVGIVTAKDGEAWVKVMGERLIEYPGMMKTKAGAKEAERKVEGMLEFKEEVAAQVECQDILEEE